MSDSRTIRQRLVPEIGDEGQLRIARATASVTSPGLSGEVEARYLAGAGFGLLRVSSHRAGRAAKETSPEVVLASDAPAIDPPLPRALAQLVDEEADAAVLAVAAAAARALTQILTAVRGADG